MQSHWERRAEPRQTRKIFTIFVWVAFEDVLALRRIESVSVGRSHVRICFFMCRLLSTILRLRWCVGTFSTPFKNMLKICFTKTKPNATLTIQMMKGTFEWIKCECSKGVWGSAWCGAFRRLRERMKNEAASTGQVMASVLTKQISAHHSQPPDD